jgi:dipeptidyl-peptidase-4
MRRRGVFGLWSPGTGLSAIGEEGAMDARDVVLFPLPGCDQPESVRFAAGNLVWLASPDPGSRRVLYAAALPDGVPRVAFDPGASERAFSLEEQLRRERLRQRGAGVTSFQVSEDGRRILVPVAGELWILDGLDTPARLLVPADGPAIEEPRISPDGAWVSFVRDAELYAVPAAGGAPVQLTSGARGTGRTNGLAEYCAQEEMGRHEGHWWSRDSELLAFEEADETEIPVWRIVHQGKDAPAHEDHRYPFAGGPNAKVRLGVIPRTGGAPRWLDLGSFEYLARVDWAPDGSLWVQTQDRAQQTLHLRRFDPATGASRLVLEERSASWINLHDLLRFLPGGAVLWASERDGWRHLYRIDGEVRQLTSGSWMVDAVVGADAEHVWFTGTLDSELERHLYVVDLAGGAPRRLTPERGMHAPVVDVLRGLFVDTHSDLDRPPRTELRGLSDGAVVRVLHDGAADPRIAASDLRPPELHRFETRDGATLNAAVYRPDMPGLRPVIVSVYGGPHVQRVQRSWEVTVQLRLQWLRSLGYAVLVVDNRGSARRGVAFESAIYRQMGDVEVRDQEDGVRWLCASGAGDPARVGIMGWSYGGYLSAMCLARAPDTFHAAVAGAPVTHWDGYDTHYTERYMALPTENPDGYHRSSVMAHVPAQRGQLLLVHGMLDENVHFRHTARLVNALNRAGKQYELLIYPDERHLPRVLADRVSMEERIRRFFAVNLA